MTNHAHFLRRVVLIPLLALALVGAGGGLFLLTTHNVPTAHAAQDIDPSYANGQTVYMIGPHMDTNPNPQLLVQAPELYLLVYPLNGDGCTTNCPPITLPSGYQPQCNPCFHPGLPIPFVYHDHLLTGSPGFGTNGTAGSFKGPWQLVLLMYNPTFIFSPGFTPITSDEALDAAEAAGEFLPINQGASNPYEVATGSLLICPLVSSHA
jgi:hypothetical protein